MRPGARVSHAKAPPTKAEQRARLAHLLLCARSLDHLTLESLVRTHGLPAHEIAAALADAQQRRAVQ